MCSTSLKFFEVYLELLNKVWVADKLQNNFNHFRCGFCQNWQNTNLKLSELRKNVREWANPLSTFQMRRPRPKEVKKWQDQEGPQSPEVQSSLFSAFSVNPLQASSEADSLVHSSSPSAPGPVLGTFLGGSLPTPGSLCQCGWVCVASRAYNSIFHHLPSLSIGARNSRGWQVATVSIKSARTSSSHIPKHAPLMAQKGFEC